MEPLRKGEFGTRLKGFREWKKIRPSDLARAAEIDRAYLFRVEQGAQEPSVSIASRLAHALGLRLADFEAARPDDLLLPEENPAKSSK